MGNCEQMSENLGRNGECEDKGDWRAALLWELTHKVVKEEGNKKERWGNGKAMRAEGPGRGKPLAGHIRLQAVTEWPSSLPMLI